LESDSARSNLPAQVLDSAERWVQISRVREPHADAAVRIAGVLQRHEVMERLEHAEQVLQLLLAAQERSTEQAAR
jgi:hypothetical protein